MEMLGPHSSPSLTGPPLGTSLGVVLSSTQRARTLNIPVVRVAVAYKKQLPCCSRRRCSAGDDLWSHF